MTETPEQSTPPQGQGGQETMWYYAVNGQQTGPVPAGQIAAWLAGGQISPHTPLWREGMPQWLPASQIEALAPAPGSFPPPMAAPPAAGAVPVDKKVRNAKQNCIAMFVVFCLSAVLTVAGLRTMGAAGAAAGSLGCFGYIGPVSAIFAMVYVPLRWRVITQLPNPFKTLGLIGGFGLIGIGLLAVALLAIGTMG